MSIPLQILLQLALVGGGIVVYDAVKSSEPPPAHHHEDAVTDHIEDKDSGDETNETLHAAPDGTGLEGNRTEAMIAKHSMQLEELKRQIALLTRMRTEDSGSTGSNASSDVPAGGEIGLAAPAGTTDEPVFDDSSIERFTAYMEEAQRRQRERRRREGYARMLKAQDVNLSAEQEEAVIDLALEYQSKARDVMRETMGMMRNDETREKRREMLQSVKKEFDDKVAELVSTADAEKISNSNVGRMFGGGMRTSGRRNNGRRGR